MNISLLDQFVILGYLGLVSVLGIWLSGRQHSMNDYFLGGRNLPWWAVSLSVVATETSTLTFISIPGLAYLSNLNFLQLALGYIVGRIVISVLFLPAYYRGELATAYELLSHRFGANMRQYASLTFQFTRLLADGVRLFATAIPLAILTGWSYPVCIMLITIFTIIYTSIGGIRSVVWMDVLQIFIYFSGAIVAGFVIVGHLPGGWAAFSDGTIPPQKLDIFYLGLEKSPLEFLRTNYTLLSGLIGGAFLSMASHGTDQLIVQRLLTCRSVGQSQKALIASGFFVFFQFAVFLGLGLLLFAFYHGQAMRSDEVFPRFIIEELPPGISGLIIASIFAAAMSTLSSSLNSLASSSMYDWLLPRWRQHIKAAHEILISRGLTLAWGVVLAGSALLFKDKSNPVVELGLAIASFTYGGLLGTFFLGTLNKDISENHALIAMWSAFFFMIGIIGPSGATLTALVTINLLAGGWIFKIVETSWQKILVVGWSIGMTVWSLRGTSPGLAWPWYVPIGSVVTYLVGWVLYLAQRAKK